MATALKLPDGAVISGHLPENSSLKAFVTVDTVFSTEIGQARRQFDGEQETETIISSLLSTVSISAYGNNAYDVCLKLKNLLQGSRLSDELRRMQAHIVRFSDVRNLTAIVGAEYQERGQFDVVLSHHHIVETALERIEQTCINTSGRFRVEIRKNV